MKRLGILGTFVWDRIWTLQDRERGEPFTSWGGIAYSLAAAAAVRPEGWEVVPLVKVGADLEREAREFLDGLPGVTVGASVMTVPEPMNRVELTYTDAAHRGERLTGGVPAWTWDELEPHLQGVDALFVNFISGFELGVEDVEALREGFAGPIYADLHSLFLGCPGAETRRLRRLPEWERWVRCFDAVQLNERELGTLEDGGAGEWAPAAERVLAAGTGLVVVTLGEEGAGYVRRTDLPADPAGWPGRRRSAAGLAEAGVAPCPRALPGDPTGAGDVWGAAFFSALLGGMETGEAFQAAHGVAARKLEHRGASGLYAHLAAGAEA